MFIQYTMWNIFIVLSLNKLYKSANYALQISVNVKLRQTLP